jgi:hypothetical protein
MRPLQLIAEIKSRNKNGIMRPILIESSPGLGKTQIASQAAKELEIGFMTIHVPLMQPEDFGLPMPSKNRDGISFLVPSGKFPFENSDCPEKGILLLDEVSQGSESLQKIIANLSLARELHGKKLKAGWTIVATGNRTIDRSGANRILGHFRNRVTSMPLDVSLDDWTTWALNNNVKTEVIAFIRFRPDLLNNFDPQKEVNATPRSWVDGVSDSLGYVSKESEFEVFKGDVGEGPASEFLSFLEIFRTLPNPDSILLDPKKSGVPTKPATQYAICGALATRVNKGNFERALTYIERLPPEFSMLFILDATRKNPEICNTKAYIKFVSGPTYKTLT